MRIEQVCFAIGFRKPTIYAWMRKRTFPKPIKIGSGCLPPDSVITYFENDQPVVCHPLIPGKVVMNPDSCLEHVIRSD
ncbi:TPA: helix-turn-helix transcriptional regulator [Enterobacter mori]